MHRAHPSWILLLVLLLAAPALARPEGARFGSHKGDPGRDPAGFVTHHAERLELDEETTRSIEAIVEASRQQSDALRDRLRDAHRTLRDLLSEDAPDESAVMAQATVIGAVETELHKERLRALLRIHALLTPEQRAELRRIRDEGPFARFRAAKEACANDRAQHCPDAPDRGPQALFCLQDHRDEVSPECGEALDALPRPPRQRRGEARD